MDITAEGAEIEKREPYLLYFSASLRDVQGRTSVASAGATLCGEK